MVATLWSECMLVLLLPASQLNSITILFEKMEIKQWVLLGLFVCLFWFFKTGFLCSFGACPGTRSVDQAVLKLTEIHLPLPPEC